MLSFKKFDFDQVYFWYQNFATIFFCQAASSRFEIELKATDPNIQRHQVRSDGQLSVAFTAVLYYGAHFYPLEKKCALYE
jgi:hypothetical protein